MCSSDLMVPVRSGLATYNGGEQAERFPNPSLGERVCLVPYLLRGVGFLVHPFLRKLLEFYGLQLHNLTPASILHIAVRRPLRAVRRLRSSFRAMEEVILPHTPYTGGVTVPSGRSRNMAHRRDRIPVRYSEEDIRGLAFGVVLYGGRPPSGPYSDGPS